MVVKYKLKQKDICKYEDSNVECKFFKSAFTSCD